MWASGQSMVEEYEKQAGRLPAEEAFGLALMYQKAVRFAATAMAASVATMVDERTSSTRQRPALTLEAAPTTSIPAKLRRIVAAGGAASSAPVLDEWTRTPRRRRRCRSSWIACSSSCLRTSLTFGSWG